MTEILDVIEELLLQGYTREAKSLFVDLVIDPSEAGELADDELQADGDYLWVEQGPTWRPRNVRAPDTPPKNTTLVFPLTEDRYT